MARTSTPDRLTGTVFGHASNARESAQRNQTSTTAGYPGRSGYMRNTQPGRKHRDAHPFHIVGVVAPYMVRHRRTRRPPTPLLQRVRRDLRQGQHDCRDGPRGSSQLRRGKSKDHALLSARTQQVKGAAGLLTHHLRLGFHSEGRRQMQGRCLTPSAKQRRPSPSPAYRRDSERGTKLDVKPSSRHSFT
jgi:hypothetical protein